MKTFEGNQIQIAFTRKPAYTAYEEPAWWAFTQDRNPDIEIAGPCETRRELETLLKVYALEGRLKMRNRQIRDLRRSLRK